MTQPNTGYAPWIIQGGPGIVVSRTGIHLTISAAPAPPPAPGDVLQELFFQNQTRPLTLQQAAPGGPFVTVVPGAIVTQGGSRVRVEASLSASLDGGGSFTFVGGIIRVLIDGVSTGLGSAATTALDGSRIALSLVAESVGILAAGAHTVELQWEVVGDGALNAIAFLLVDTDGAGMIVREVAA